MKPWTASHWTSYFHSGLIALAVSGCQFGNREINAAPADPYSGYYATQAQSMSVTVTYGSPQLTATGSASPTLIPVDMGVSFSNPSSLQYTGPENAIVIGDPSNPNGNNSFSFASSGTFNGNASYAAQTLWSDPSCTYTENITVFGGLEPVGNTPNPMSAMGTSFSLLGRLSIDSSVSYRILPDLPTCSASLQAMYQCYSDSTSCAGSTSANQQANYSFVQSLFQTAIQSGIMTETDIQTATGVVFEANYQ